jgi:hypothetical protein
MEVGRSFQSESIKRSLKAYCSEQSPQTLVDGVALDIKMPVFLVMDSQTAVPYTVTHVCTSFGRCNGA